MPMTEEQKRRMEENRAVALARRQLKLNSTRTSGAITTFNGATNGPAGGATRTSGANTTFNGATNGSAGGASYNHNAANANRYGSIPSNNAGPSATAPRPQAGSIAQPGTAAAASAGQPVKVGSFSSSTFYSNASPEAQKRAIEQKRLAALAKRNSVLSSQTSQPSTATHQSLNNMGYKMNPPGGRVGPNLFTKVEPIKPSKKATCTLVERTRFKVIAPYHEGLIQLFKTMKTSQYHATARDWSFHIEEHDKLVKAVGQLKSEIELAPLPKWVLETFRIPAAYSPEDVDLGSIEPTVLAALMPFQREGIQYAISRGGRVLIADDMGLGKTIQALGLASYYSDAWPFLVVAPSSMRFAWESAILRWLPRLTPEDITTVSSGKDFIGTGSVVVISYDLLSKKSRELAAKKFNLVIMDESHCIKNDKSVRTKAAEPLMRDSRYLILLTGTPALSRPMELFSQISALSPRTFKYAKEFGFRYCDGQTKKFGAREVLDFSGASNMGELSLLLLETCMVRRLKSDVLQQLPTKQRCMILLDQTKVDTSSKRIVEKEEAAQQSKGLSSMEKRGLLLQWYSATAESKVKAVQDYVKDLLTSDQKFLLFCHHQVMIAGMTELLESTGTGFIKIDGNTPSDLRKTFVDRFQTSPACQVALLSITAANSGITLTSASLVVFAEIYWNPGILTQAEDRAHRIGQTDSVTIQYLVARGTADDQLWPMIQKKLEVLNKAGLTKDNFQDSEAKVLKDESQKTIDQFFSKEEEKVEADDDLADLFDDEWEDEMLNIDEPAAAKKPKLT